MSHFRVTHWLDSYAVLIQKLKRDVIIFRLLSFPDNNHPIAKVEAESDVFINVARWFHEHLKK